MGFRDELVVAGPDTAVQTIATTAGEVTWGLRPPPGVAHALLGVSMREVADRRVAMADLVALPTVDDPRGVAEHLEQVVQVLWRRADPDRDALRLAASLDRGARAGRPVPEIAAQHALSERSLRRLSDRVFGYGPVTLARIHRFQRALRQVQAGELVGVAAAAAGYADQAHFAREAHRFAGCAPSALDPRGRSGQAAHR